MNISEAVNTAEQLKNTYQAFAKIEEVLKIAQAQEQEIGQREKQLEKLKARIAAGHAELAGFNDRVTAGQIRAQTVETETKESVKKAKAEAEKTLAHLNAATKAEIERLEDERKAHTEKFQRLMLEAAEEEAKKRGELAALEKKIEDLRGVAKRVFSEA